jgi:hypothetical protein
MHITRKLLILGIMMAALHSGTTLAQSKALTTAAHAIISSAVDPDRDFTKTSRAKIVQNVATYCGEILKALPTNTPSEDAWVAAEAKTSDLAKVERLLSSPEWSRRELKSTFSDCKDLSQTLIQNQAVVNRTDAVARAEAINLVGLALIFNDTSDIESYASRANFKLGYEPTSEPDLFSLVRKDLLIAARSALKGQ